MGVYSKEQEESEVLLVFDLQVHDFSFKCLRIAPRLKTEDLLKRPPLFTVSVCSPLFPCLTIAQDDFKDDLCLCTTEKKDNIVTYFCRGLTVVTAIAPKELRKFTACCSAMVKLMAKWKDTEPEYAGSGSIKMEHLLQSLLVGTEKEPIEYGKVVSNTFNVDIKNQDDFQGQLKLTLKITCCGKSAKTSFVVDQERGSFVLKKDIGNKELFELSHCLTSRDPDLKFRPMTEKTCSYGKVGSKEPPEETTKPQVEYPCDVTEQAKSGAGFQSSTQEHVSEPAVPHVSTKREEKHVEHTKEKEKQGTVTKPTGKKNGLKKGKVSVQGLESALKSDLNEERKRCECNVRTRKKVDKSGGDTKDIDTKGAKDQKPIEMMYSTRIFQIDELIADIYGKQANLRMRTQIVTIAEDEGSNVTASTSEDGMSAKESKLSKLHQDSQAKDACIHSLTQTRKNSLLPGGYSLALLPKRVNLLVKEIQAIKKKEADDAKARKLAELKTQLLQQKLKEKQKSPKPAGPRKPVKLDELVTEEEPVKPVPVQFKINETMCVVSLDPEWNYEVRKPEDEGGDPNAPIKLQICKKQRSKSPTEIVSESSFQMRFQAPMDEYGGKEKRHDMMEKKLREYSKDVQAMDEDFPKAAPPAKKGKK